MTLADPHPAVVTPDADDPKPARLLVLVSSACEECRRAAGIAAEFARQTPHVDVQVVDVALDPVPDGVILVGTPMYIDVTFEPTVLFLGNPAADDLARHFRSTR